MTEEEIVKKVCEIMGVKYSHYDNHKMSLDYFRPTVLKSIPKIVVYSSSYGYWQFSILEDMTIHTMTTPYNKMLVDSFEHLKQKENISSADKEDLLKDINKRMININKEIAYIAEAEKFLKENNCSEIINNPKKKINWV